MQGKRIGVTILRWNAHSLIAHGQELKKHIIGMKTKLDIICMQEAWLTEKLDYKIQGYSARTHTHDRKTGKDGDFCTFIKENLNNLEVEVKKLNIEHNATEILMQNNYTSMTL